MLKLKKILISLLYIIALFSYNLTSPAKAADKLKVVYHVSEIEKVPFVLGNMRNHINGVGGPGKVDLILVVHGPAGKAFHKSKTNPKIEQRVDNLSIDGVKFNMCGNTMRAQKVGITDLLSGFSRHDEGGVVRIAELQSKGYIYIRP